MLHPSRVREVAGIMGTKLGLMMADPQRAFTDPDTGLPIGAGETVPRPPDSELGSQTRARIRSGVILEVPLPDDGDADDDPVLEEELQDAREAEPDGEKSIPEEETSEDEFISKRVAELCKKRKPAVVKMAEKMGLVPLSGATERDVATLIAEHEWLNQSS